MGRTLYAMSNRKYNVKVGDIVYLRVISGLEWSTYRITITEDDFKGNGLENVFLFETTGTECDEESPTEVV